MTLPHGIHTSNAGSTTKAPWDAAGLPPSDRSPAEPPRPLAAAARELAPETSHPDSTSRSSPPASQFFLTPPISASCDVAMVPLPQAFSLGFRQAAITVAVRCAKVGAALPAAAQSSSQSMDTMGMPHCAALASFSERPVSLSGADTVRRCVVLLRLRRFSGTRPAPTAVISHSINRLISRWAPATASNASSRRIRCAALLLCYALEPEWLCCAHLPKKESGGKGGCTLTLFHIPCPLLHQAGFDTFSSSDLLRRNFSYYSPRSPHSPVNARVTRDISSIGRATSSGRYIAESCGSANKHSHTTRIGKNPMSSSSNLRNEKDRHESRDQQVQRWTAHLWIQKAAQSDAFADPVL